MLGVVLGVACKSSPSSGPCSVSYDEPLFSVTRATDARTGAPLQQIALREFSYNGNSNVELAFLTEHLGLTPRRVAIRNGELLCEVACGFGAAEGQYSLTFGAPGYRDTSFVIAAQFDNRRGNCPAFLSGGRILNLAFTPQ